MKIIVISSINGIIKTAHTHTHTHTQMLADCTVSLCIWLVIW